MRGTFEKISRVAESHWVSPNRVLVAGVIGMGVGGVYGSYRGIQGYVRRDHYERMHGDTPINYVVPAALMYTFVGGVTGAVWPIGVPIVVVIGTSCSIAESVDSLLHKT